MSEQTDPPPIDLSKALDLTVKRAACPKHGEPFRAQWPKGWAMFSVKIMSEVLMDPAFPGEWGKLAGENDFRKMEAALDRKPACERVSNEFLLQLYEECGVGEMRTCSNCCRHALGTPYRTIDPRTKWPREYAHICFQCLLHQMRVIPPN
jgi:hypothetical protein